MINELSLLEKFLEYLNVEPKESNVENKKYYLAITTIIPTLNTSMSLDILLSKYGEIKLKHFKTTPVKNIIYKEQNILFAETLKAYYIILLPCHSPSNTFFAKALALPSVGHYASFNEIVFSISNSKYLLGITRKSNLLVTNVLKVSDNIYYVSTKHCNYYLLI